MPIADVAVDRMLTTTGHYVEKSKNVTTISTISYCSMYSSSVRIRMWYMQIEYGKCALLALQKYI